MKTLQSDTVVMSPPARARSRTVASSAHPAQSLTGVGSRSQSSGSSMGAVLYRVGSLMSGTTLYNSTYRADDQMLVNAHMWGINAYGAPVWHLRRHGDGGLFDTCVRSFDAVWETARPVES